MPLLSDTIGTSITTNLTPPITSENQIKTPLQQLLALIGFKTPYVTVEEFGTITENPTANAVIFAEALATGKMLMLGKRRYKVSFTVGKQKVVGQGFSSGWGAGNEAATIIEGKVSLTNQACIENFNVEDGTSNGVEVRGFSVSIKNVGVHKCAGNGFDLTGTDAHNLNHFRLEGIAATYNTGAGVLIDNVTTDPNLPNANVGTGLNLDLRHNGGGGIYLNRAIDNTFDGVAAEENTGFGIRLMQYAKGNVFNAPYLEANTGGELYLDAGSTNNYINGDRSGNSTSYTYLDYGTDNRINDKVYNIPRVRKLTVGKVQFLDTDEGRFLLEKSNQSLKITLTNTGLNGKVLLQHNSTSSVGLGFKEGGNNAVASAFLFKTASGTDFGTVSAQSTKVVDVSFSEIVGSEYMLRVQPVYQVIPSGCVLDIVYKNTGVVSLRMTNVTGSGISVGSFDLVIHAIRMYAF